VRITLLFAVVFAISGCRVYRVLCAVEKSDGTMVVAHGCRMVGEIAVCQDGDFARPKSVTCTEEVIMDLTGKQQGAHE
jgi:hypothetical protein